MNIKRYIPDNIKISIKKFLISKIGVRYKPEIGRKRPHIEVNGKMSFCICCGSTQITYSPILWEELIQQWGLTDNEIEYTNRQQGIHCNRCRTNLRTMALAFGMMKYENYNGLFQNFVHTRKILHSHILEVNKAGNLTQFFYHLRNHNLVEYPNVDIQDLPYNDSSYDIVLHSDTLEHIPDPIRALEECYRILKPGGYCIFTVPILIEKLTRNRNGLPKSYHGSQSSSSSELLVYNEFGVDVWKYALLAGFSVVSFFSLEYPAAQSILCKK